MSNTTNEGDKPTCMLAHKRVLIIMKASSGVTLSDATLFLKRHGLLSNDSVTMKSWSEISDQIPENWRPRLNSHLLQPQTSRSGATSPIKKWDWCAGGIDTNNHKVLH